METSIYLMDILDLGLHCRTVTTTSASTPCDHRSICKDCSECIRTNYGLNLLHPLQLILHSRTVTTGSAAPRHNAAICQNRSKCTPIGLKLLHTPQLMLDFGAVNTRSGIAPCNDRTIFQEGGKCILSAPHLLDTPELMLDSRAVTSIPPIAAGDNPVTSSAPQGKGLLCCLQLPKAQSDLSNDVLP